MGAIGEIVAAIAVKFLREWLARSDVQRGERQRLIIEALALERAALEWLALAHTRPDHGVTVRVLSDAPRASGFRPTAPHGPADGPVSDG